MPCSNYLLLLDPNIVRQYRIPVRSLPSPISTLSPLQTVVPCFSQRSLHRRVTPRVCPIPLPHHYCCPPITVQVKLMSKQSQYCRTEL